MPITASTWPRVCQRPHLGLRAELFFAKNPRSHITRPSLFQHLTLQPRAYSSASGIVASITPPLLAPLRLQCRPRCPLASCVTQARAFARECVLRNPVAAHENGNDIVGDDPAEGLGALAGNDVKGNVDNVDPSEAVGNYVAGAEPLDSATASNPTVQQAEAATTTNSHVSNISPSFWLRRKWSPNDDDIRKQMLENIIGYQFRDSQYMKSALWTTAVKLDGVVIPRIQMQLAIMGDCILKLAYFLSHFPSSDPVEVNRPFDKLINNRRLTIVAHKTGLGRLMVPESLDAKSWNMHRGGTLVEAVIAAVWLDSGCDIHTTTKVIDRLGIYDSSTAAADYSRKSGEQLPEEPKRLNLEDVTAAQLDVQYDRLEMNQEETKSLPVGSPSSAYRERKRRRQQEKRARRSTKSVTALLFQPKQAKDIDTAPQRPIKSLYWHFNI